MKIPQITADIREALLKDKKYNLVGIGTIKLVPARKGRHFDMVKREWVDGTKKKWRMVLHQSIACKQWVKQIDAEVL